MTNIKTIFLLIFLSQQLVSSTTDDFFLGVKYNSTSEKNEIYKINQATGESTLLKDFAFPSGFWQPGASFLDSYNGNLFLKDSNGTYISYNPNTDTLSTMASVDTDFQVVFQTPWMGKDLIHKNASTGETHIGENSLVTNEVDGRQLLYATNASGEKIDINISNGSDLKINNKSVAGAIAATIAMNQIEISERGLSVGVGLGSFAGSNKMAVGLGYADDINENLSYVFKASTSNNEYGAGVTFNFK
jgi:hypothetical protein